MNKLLILAPKPRRIISISSLVVADQFETTTYRPEFFGIQQEQETLNSNMRTNLGSSIQLTSKDNTRSVSSFN